MTDKQPEALRLAKELDCFRINDETLLATVAELRRLHKMEQAYYHWIRKTEWVQESCAAEELGMHRADVMTQRIERLSAINAALMEALRKISRGGDPHWADDAIDKATGKQQ